MKKSTFLYVCGGTIFSGGITSLMGVLKESFDDCVSQQDLGVAILSSLLIIFGENIVHFAGVIKHLEDSGYDINIRFRFN